MLHSDNSVISGVHIVDSDGRTVVSSSVNGTKTYAMSSDIFLQSNLHSSKTKIQQMHISKLEQHDRSLQELDEVVANSSIMANQHDRSSTFGGDATNSTKKKKIYMDNMEEVQSSLRLKKAELVRGKSGQSTQSTRSGRSRKSRKSGSGGSIRNSQKKRGNSLERDISKTILEMAAAAAASTQDDSSRSHFSAPEARNSNNATLEAAASSDSFSTSAHFILNDLFNEASTTNNQDEASNVDVTGDKNGNFWSPAIQHEETLVHEHYNDFKVKKADTSNSTTFPAARYEMDAGTPNVSSTQEGGHEEKYNPRDLIYSCTASSEMDPGTIIADSSTTSNTLPAPWNNSQTSEQELGISCQTSSKALPSEIESRSCVDDGGDDDDLFDGLDNTPLPATTNKYERRFELQQSANRDIDVIQEADEENESSTTFGENSVPSRSEDQENYDHDVIKSLTTGTLSYSVDDSLLGEENAAVVAAVLQAAAARAAVQHPKTTCMDDHTEQKQELTNDHNFQRNNGSLQKVDVFTSGSDSDAAGPMSESSTIGEQQEKDADSGTENSHAGTSTGSPANCEQGAEVFDNFLAPSGSWTIFDGSTFGNDAAFSEDDVAFIPFQESVSSEHAQREKRNGRSKNKNTNYNGEDKNKNSNGKSSNITNTKLEPWKRRSQRNKLIVETVELASFESPKANSSSPSYKQPQSPSSIIDFNGNSTSKRNIVPSSKILSPKNHGDILWANSTTNKEFEDMVSF